MMDPISAIIILAIQAAQVYATYDQGVKAAEAQENMADVHEATADNERLAAQYAAEQEEQRRLSERRAERSDQKRRRAAMHAAYAKSGVAFKGTPTAMIAEQFKVDEFNLMMGDQASHEDEKQVLWQGENRAINEENQAKAYRAQARNTMRKANAGLALDIVGAAAGAGLSVMEVANTAQKVSSETAGAAGGNAGGAFGGMLGDQVMNAIIGSVGAPGPMGSFATGYMAGGSFAKSWKNRGKKKLAPRVNAYSGTTRAGTGPSNRNLPGQTSDWGGLF